MFEQPSFNIKNPLNFKTICKGNHVYIIDNEGIEYLDSMSGFWCVSLGYSNKKIKKNIQIQLNNLAYSNNMYQTTNLSQKFIEKLVPYFSHFKTVYFTNSGSMSCELAYRLAINFFNSPKKMGVCYLKYSYHGSSFISSLCSDQDTAFFGTPFNINNRYCVPIETQNGIVQEDLYITFLEKLFKKYNDKICLFIIEPIIGYGGVYKINKSTLEKTKKLCLKYNILLAIDEVVTGFGKTGKMFYANDIKSDFSILGKGLTNGFVPLSAVLINEKVMNGFEKIKLPFGFTFSSHPLGLAAGIAVMEETETILKNNLAVFNFKINKQNLEIFKKIKEIRQTGCMGSIEFYSKKDAEYVAHTSWEQGIVLHEAGNPFCVNWCLPLICSYKEINLFEKRLLNLLESVESIT